MAAAASLITTPETMAYLVSLGADVNDKSDGGSTVLETCLRNFAWREAVWEDTAFFVRVLDASPHVARQAHLAFLAGGLAPLIGAAQAYIRGMLTAHHLTVSRLLAVLVSMVALVISLEVGIALKFQGVIVAGGALTVALLAELGVLAYAWSRGKAHIDSGDEARVLIAESEVAG